MPISCRVAKLAITAAFGLMLANPTVQAADFDSELAEAKALRGIIEGTEKADLLIRNVKIVDVYREGVFPGSLLVSGGRIVAVDPENATAKAEFDGQGLYAVVATRRDLDAALVDRARKEGAEIAEGAALTSIANTADGVVAEVEGLGEVRARFAVGADGMWSPTRKLLGAGVEGYRGEWHAFRQYVGGVSGRAAIDLVVFFEPDFLPGYFWSFPLPAWTRQNRRAPTQRPTASGCVRR